MLWFSLLLITILVFFSVSIACLPFLCERNRGLAIRNKRSLYDKSAKHLAFFGAIAFFAFGISLFLDYYLNGFIVQEFIRPKFLDIIFLSIANLFLLGGIVFFILLKLGKTSQRILFRFNFLVGVILLLLVSLLSWLYLRSTLIFPKWSFVQLWTHEPLQILFFVYILFCVFLGLMGAHILSIIFFIIRRNSDDYGRDYYNTLITSHAKRAMYSGLLLCIPLAILVVALPVCYNRLKGLLLELSHWGIVDAPKNISNCFICEGVSCNYVYLYASLFVLFILLSILCMQRIAKSALPMQKKSFIFFAFNFLALGLAAVMFRLWY